MTKARVGCRSSDEKHRLVVIVYGVHIGSVQYISLSWTPAMFVFVFGKKLAALETLRSPELTGTGAGVCASVCGFTAATPLVLLQQTAGSDILPSTTGGWEARANSCIYPSGVGIMEQQSIRFAEPLTEDKWSWMETLFYELTV